MEIPDTKQKPNLSMANICIVSFLKYHLFPIFVQSYCAYDKIELFCFSEMFVILL
jgi:hypothetical protein